MPNFNVKEPPELRQMDEEQRRRYWKAVLTPPKTLEELQMWVYKVLGVWIPNAKVCPHHQPPMQAFANAYFAETERSVWTASRGLGGKTINLSILSLTESITLGAGVSLLGGTGEQALRVLKYMSGQEMHGAFWTAPRAPRHLLQKDVARETSLTNGGWIYALMASTASVRGPHPQRLRGDEIDEMDRKIWDAAAGQPMTRHGIRDHILGSSTHHYADKTMTEELRMASERGWPVYRWCWREGLRTKSKDDFPQEWPDGTPVNFPEDAEPNPNGWLTWEQVKRKRASVPTLMWETEYELQEPAVEGRAIQTPAVDWMFDPEFGEHRGELGTKLIIEEPQEGGKYCAGADWGKNRDKTIIKVYRYDLYPARLVAYFHLARQPYPVMIAAYDDLVKRYKAAAAYDATGLGTVVEDYTESAEAVPVSLNGTRRSNIFSDYVVAIEGREIKEPRIGYAYNEHKFVTAQDLYGTGGHPPDTFVAGALAWWAKDFADRPLFI